jgi:hypothetical protein
MGDHQMPGGWVDRWGSLKWVPVPSSRTVRVLVALATLLVVAFLAWLMFQLISLAGQVRGNDEKLAAGKSRDTALSVQNQRQDQALAEANRRLKALGKATVPVPPAVTLPPVTGPTGLQGPMGPAGPQGPQGPEGGTGQAGTAGKAGSPGSPGSPGETGTAGTTGEQGPAGPAGTDGKDGASAYPFTFTFVIDFPPGHTTTYTCTLTAPGVAATCSAVAS